MRRDFFGASVKWILMGALATMLIGPVVAQDQPAPAKKPPSQEEYKDFMAIVQSADAKQKTELADQFFAKYPESDYTAQVHYYVTYAYGTLGQQAKVVEHGTKGANFQKDANILSLIANAHADLKQNSEAAAMANEALKAADTFPKPEGVSQEDWDKRMKTIKGANHFLLGKMKFEEGQNEKVAAKKKLIMTEAKASFQSAAATDTKNGIYYYYLGLVSGELNQSQETLDALAKAAVLEGPAQSYAEKDLEKFFMHYNKGSKKGLDQLKVKAKADVEKQ